MLNDEPQSDSTTAGWRDRSTEPSANAARQRSLERATAFVYAALQIVEETAETEFSVRQVIERAGLSRRAFYEVFDGKDDLLVAVYEEATRSMVTGFNTRLAGVGDPLERLKVIVAGLFLRTASDKSMRRALRMTREYLRLTEMRPEAMRAAMDPAIRFLAAELQAGMDVGAVRKGDPETLAMLVFHMGAGHVARAFLNATTPGSPALTVEQLWDFCRGALAPAPHDA